MFGTVPAAGHDIGVGLGMDHGLPLEFAQLAEHHGIKDTAYWAAGVAHRIGQELFKARV